MSQRIIFIFACALLSACAPEITAENSRSVTIHHYLSSAADTQKLADAYCAKYNRVAVAQNDPDNYANVFECVDK